MGLFDWLFGKRQVPTVPTISQAKSLNHTQPVVPHFAIIDVETTGLSPRQNRIIELEGRFS